MGHEDSPPSQLRDGDRHTHTCELATLFSSWETVRGVTAALLADLNAALARATARVGADAAHDATEIGDVFEKLAPFFKT